MTAIRLANPDDVPAIAALIDAAYSHYIPTLAAKPRPMLDDHAARVARSETYVLDDGASLSAVITMGEPKPGGLHIFNIAVHPDAQGRGILKQLLGFAEDEARRRALPRLTLYTHALMTRNREIYAHLGFEVLGLEDGGGYTIVFMQRPVS